MTFKLVKTLSGKVRVKYACPHCNESLESELAEAGSQDTCPACQKQFVVPGEAKRKEFEAQLRAQLEARKEAERQRQAEAEAERRRAEEAAALAAREAEREDEPAATAPSSPWADSGAADAYTPPTLPRRTRRSNTTPGNATPSNTSYPALEFYIWLLRIAGWICIGLFGLYVVVGGILAIVGAAFAQNAAGLGMSLASYVFGFFPAAVSTLLPSLMLFVSAQLLQLALDARRDLAKLVAQRVTDE